MHPEYKEMPNTKRALILLLPEIRAPYFPKSHFTNYDEVGYFLQSRSRGMVSSIFFDATETSELPC